MWINLLNWGFWSSTALISFFSFCAISFFLGFSLLKLKLDSQIRKGKWRNGFWCKTLCCIIWVKVLKNGPTQICGRQLLKKLKRYGSQIFLGQFLNTSTHINTVQTHQYIKVCWKFNSTTKTDTNDKFLILKFLILKFLIKILQRKITGKYFVLTLL